MFRTTHAPDRQRHERPSRTDRRRADGVHTGCEHIRGRGPQHRGRFLTRECVPLVRGTCTGVPQDGASNARCLLTVEQSCRRQQDRAKRNLRLRHPRRIVGHGGPRFISGRGPNHGEGPFPDCRPLPASRSLRVSSPLRHFSTSLRCTQRRDTFRSRLRYGADQAVAVAL